MASVNGGTRVIHTPGSSRDVFSVGGRTAGFSANRKNTTCYQTFLNLPTQGPKCIPFSACHEDHKEGHATAPSGTSLKVK